MSEAKMGARVNYCGHDGWFVADIHRIGDCNVVRANGEVTPGNLVRCRPHEATHIVLDFPTAGFWNPRLGVFVVPEDQVREVVSRTDIVPSCIPSDWNPQRITVESLPYHRAVGPEARLHCVSDGCEDPRIPEVPRLVGADGYIRDCDCRGLCRGCAFKESVL